MHAIVALVAATAVTGTAGAAVTWRLDPATAYAEGCYDPCDCILLQVAGVTGSFRLEPVQLTGTYDVYALTDIDWTVPWVDGRARAVTGTGTLEIFSEVAVTKRLQLDVVVAPDPERHFDSGWVVTIPADDDIDLDASVNGFVCLDWAFFLEARALPEDVSGDGTVGIADLVAVILAWGPCPADAPCPADVDGDGTVGVADLVQVVLGWDG